MILRRMVFPACVGALLLAGGLAAAQDYAPTPHKSPRTPVSRQALADRRIPLPTSRTVTGNAIIIDTERLLVDDIEMRLFGVVPPQLSASFGPQARAVLDGLNAAGPVSCYIRDRDRDSRFLATCRDAKGADLALELLRRGLAATARGSLRPTELAAPYEAAEQEAQSQKLGLWSVALPAAVSDSSIMTGMASAAAQVAAKEAASKTEAKPTSVTVPVAEKPASAALQSQHDAADTPASAKASADTPKPAAIPTPAQKPAQTGPANAPANILPPLPAADVFADALQPVEDEQPGFFARYQLLVTGLLMLFTALGVTGSLIVQRWHERREELRSIAAALRGEMMAARAVCHARLNMLADADEKSTTWPRIRALVFQAYVGRLGRLGAELARQIASIYGQASDYAAYYNAAQAPDARFEPVSKRMALQTLVQHIEEVLPRLAQIERGAPAGTGSTSAIARRPVAQLQPVSPVPVSYEEPPRETHAEPAFEIISVPDSPEGTSTVSTPETRFAQTMPPTPLWGKIKKLATERLDRRHVNVTPTNEESVPDYTALIEEENVTLAYDEKAGGTVSETAAMPEDRKRQAF
jgi:endonuclease YncB( thermonuclease family)